MQDFRNLDVWKLAHELTLHVYQVTKQFPKEETYGLTSQLRRCSASIAANIAEGCIKQSDVEFRRFLYIALGSVSEVDYFLLLSEDLTYLDSEVATLLQRKVKVLRRKLISFIQKLTVTKGPQPIAQSS